MQLAACGLLFAQPKLSVDNDIDSDSLVLEPQNSAPVPAEGRIYYDNAQNQLLISTNGTSFEGLSGGGLLRVATIIVAASDSMDTTGTAPNMTNPKADYTCQGTDDQKKINEAIRALPASGGVVYLLEGTYNISNALLSGMTIKGVVIDKSNVSLIGAGNGTVLRLVSGTGSVKVINASGTSTNNKTNILISRLMIDGNTQTGSSNNGIYFNYVAFSKITRVGVEQVDDYGIYLYKSSNNILSGNNLQNNYEYGLRISYSSNNNIISGNNLQGSRTSILLGEYAGSVPSSASNNNIFFGNNVQGNNYESIFNSFSSNNIFFGNNIHDNPSMGFYNIISPNTIFFGNNVSGNSGAGIIIGQDAPNSILFGNNIQGNTSQGIILTTRSSNSVIFGNIIYDNGGISTQAGIEIRGAVPSGGGDGTCNNNLIASNYISDNAGPSGLNWAYMIDIKNVNGSNPDDDCNNNYITGNDLDLPAGYIGNLAQISDLGKYTKYTEKEKITLEPRTHNVIADGVGIDPRNPPASHIVLNNTAALTIAITLFPGKSAGDVLILEAASSSSPINLADAGFVNLSAPLHTFGPFDTLELIYNGTQWVEVSWTDVP